MRNLRLPHLSLTGWIVLVIVIIAAFNRLFRIPENLQFLGDQGRDAIVVARIFKQHDLVFIGPVTSVGNMYLGPLYYYFMLPFLWLSYPSPLGPAYAVAILGILTVWLVYKWGKELVGETPAVIAAGLYAITSTVIIYTRFSWNPNPAPFVSLAMIYATYKAWTKNPRWWILVAACFAVLMQLHYVTLLTAGGAGLIWLAGAYQQWPTWRKKPQKAWSWLWPILVGALIVALSLTPLVLFDARHDWLNVRAFTKLSTQEKSFKSAIPEPVYVQIADTVKEMHGRSLHIFFEYVIGKNRTLNTLLLVGLLAIVLKVLVHSKEKQQGLWVLLAYLFTSVVGLSFYEHTVFDHYVSYLFPVTFLLYGVALGWLWHHKLTKILVIAAVLGIAYYNVPRWPLHRTGWTIREMSGVADTIYQHLKPGEKYNIVLLSDSGDLEGLNYRYFLNTTDRPPVPTEQRGSVETLVVINEDHKLRPDQIPGSPIYEIVTFPDKTPKEVYTIPGGPDIIFLRTRP